MKRSPWIFGLGAVVLTMGIAACGGDDDDVAAVGSSSGQSVVPPSGGSSGVSSTSSSSGSTSNSSSSGSANPDGGTGDGGTSDAGDAGTSDEVSCLDIQETLEPLAARLGACEANDDNEEPLAFDETACDNANPDPCVDDNAYVRAYITCLGAVAECNADDQDVYDEAIQDCLDAFQNSDATGECIELVVGD